MGYWDTSALVKLHVGEPDSAQYDALALASPVVNGHGAESAGVAGVGQVREGVADVRDETHRAGDVQRADNGGEAVWLG